MVVGHGGDAMSERVQGTWVRQRYFAQDGFLRPVQGSRRTWFDPLRAARAQEEARNDGRPLYLQFTDLDSQADFERFASAWGLLGLLPHRVLFARHAFEGDDWLLDKRIVPLNHPRASQEVTESPGYWRWPACRPLRREPSRFWGVESPFGAALCLEGPNLDAAVAPLEELWRPYFPGMELPGPWLPGIFSLDWWDCYSEPVAGWREAQDEVRSFLALSERLYTAGSAAGGGAAADAAEDDDAEDGSSELEPAMIRLQRHLSGVHPGAFPTVSGWEWVWSFPSLYAAMFFMLLEDLTQRRLRRCGCGRWFASGRDARQYCSGTCRGTTKKRQQRERKRKRQRAEAKGGDQ